MSIYFISDLHLSPEHESGSALFFKFMRELAPKAQALYVLGDLFEAWVGDDDDDAYVLSIIDEFKRFSDNGHALYFLRGNRDFLLGTQFAEKCVGTLLEDESCITLGHERALLLHGDQLCTDDVEYQKFRAMVRTPQWQQGLLSKSLAERKAIAAAMRLKSRESQQNKAEYITDVNTQAVQKILAQYKLNILIHGHTHRPNIHELTWNGNTATRYVLGDWHESAQILRFDGSLHLETIRL